MRTVTIAQVIAAMEKNGYEWLRDGRYFHDPSYSDIDGPIAACVYGQAAFNLNVDPAALHSALITGISEISSIHHITGYNDHDAVSYEDAVAFAKAALLDQYTPDTTIELKY